jgi:hypothetical protein
MGGPALKLPPSVDKVHLPREGAHQCGASEQAAIAALGVVGGRTSHSIGTYLLGENDLFLRVVVIDHVNPQVSKLEHHTLVLNFAMPAHDVRAVFCQTRVGRDIQRASL